MTNKDLRIGDRIRITSIAGNGNPDFYIHVDTVRVYKKLIKRNRSVRIKEIDQYGQPWYECKFKKKDGTWEYHFLSVAEGDNNWILVKKRNLK